ncbi:hypothetical protein K227x_44740 [Rubripirellula lacrimiformis]|uniref:Uncharacterized protein n=1 Tax=Rubripirellula lacrimiformis TaxID=1930273 RepID=A0A517NFZ5_9BACT|nr:hypothetical protein [Rubripirellula lacrimiformis]QDT06067.1 hypothetical protein K227x_44740 [Rubripirellula lacrimiformis]
MTFEQSIVVGNVVVPALIGLVACVIAALISGRTSAAPNGIADATSPLRPRSLIAAAVIAIGWLAAVTVSMSMRQGWQWWPEDAWRQAVWPLLAWTVWGIAATAPQVRSKPEYWILAGLLAGVTALRAMPADESWADTFPFHRTWMMAILASCLVNIRIVDRVSQRGGSRWSLLIALAALGGPMALAASAYASLSEWAMSIIVATAVIAIAGIAFARIPAWVVAPATLASAAGLVAAGRFYSYEEHPTWLFGLLLFGPAIVGVVDGLIDTKSTTVRVVVAGAMSGAIVAISAYQIMA